MSLIICRRILTMEWVTGVKLTTLPPEEVRDLVGVGQEAFLVQLLEVGFFHGDPHPGNLLKVRHPPCCVVLCVMMRWCMCHVC
jgi:predicted unusual protein kinase regulating ubiquinone biosynthesis (AarF/ABC1/UbiB family)